MRFFICACLFLIGCGSTKEIRIEDRTLTIVPPVIEDSLNAYTLYGGTDTVYIEGSRVVLRDTTIIVKYFPKTERFYVKTIPDTIRVSYRDTLSIIEERVIRTPFLSKVGLVGIGFVLCVVLLAGVFIYFRFKPF
jgi:hypothetical protein